MEPRYGGTPTERAQNLSDFKQLSLLGEGAYSAVYKVQRLADGETYALKKVKLPSLSDKEKQNALNEIRLLASVRHENVISYKEAFFDDKTRCLCIVTECADGGDLLNQINKCQKERTHIPEADLWRYFVGMCNGLQALHRMKILHRDMKCANIFLGSSPRGLVAKLGDFNVSTVAKRGLCMTQTGTPYYASPEVWRDMPYDGKSDIWSLGCVLYEACALRPPFQAKDMEGLYRRVLRGQYPRIPNHFSQDMAEVIAQMLQVNPRHRPTAELLLQLPAVRQKAGELGLTLPGDGDGASDLLRTIKVPRNVIDLSAYLPLPQYDDTLRKLIAEASANPTPSVSARRGGGDGAGDSLDAYMRKAADGLPHRSMSADRCISDRGGDGQSAPRPPRPQRERSEPPPSTGGGMRLPRILSKVSSRSRVGGSAAVPRLPRIPSTPSRLQPVA
mmetsp:Transcript_57420/g.161083  ORF Transcript_57420/g.161083 Transcript_57420/m.161083 type:complete len:446 (+) Transcript_57420:91-1428(+)